MPRPKNNSSGAEYDDGKGSRRRNVSANTSGHRSLQAIKTNERLGSPKTREKFEKSHKTPASEGELNSSEDFDDSQESITDRSQESTQLADTDFSFGSPSPERTPEKHEKTLKNYARNPIRKQYDPAGELDNIYKKQTSIPLKHVQQTTAHNSAEKTQLPSSNEVLKFIAVIFAVALVCLCYMAYSNSEDKPINVIERQLISEQFDLNFNDLMSKFPNQGRRFWKTLKAATKAVLSDANPAQPIIIMIASTKSNHPTAECIAKHLSHSITKSYPSASDVLSIDMGKYPSASSDSIKMSIDNDLKKAFRSGSRAALINRVHEFPGKSAMIFHAYCDNENAPYKDVGIIFTVHTNDEASLTAQRVEEHLSIKWADDLDIDMLSPLMSRVGNNIAIVEGEGQDILDRHCY